MAGKTIKEKNQEIYQSNDFAEVRRDELAVTDDAWIKAVLQRGAYGVLATTCGDQPFLNPNSYVYDEASHCIYFHRSKTGRTSANLEHNPRVCYTVVEMGRMVGGPGAMDFGVEYHSVVVFGVAERVEYEEAKKALRMLLEKYAPHMQYGVDYEPMTPHCPRTAAVYKIKIEQWSGKAKEAASDNPFAFDYPVKWTRNS
jgi:uncharacterized protein